MPEKSPRSRFRDVTALSQRSSAAVRARVAHWRAWVTALENGPLRPVVRAVVLPWRLFKIACFLLGLVVLVVGTGSVVYVNHFFASLPALETMTMKDLQIIGMRRVNERLNNKRAFYRWVPVTEINRGYLYSIVASEDATFFEHDGFNFEAIMDSLAENLRERKPAFGASTISQQVVKNLFLTSEKTITRKLKEFLITRTLERYLTKNQILELYLNIAEFGPDIYGAEAAARHYFGKTAAEMNAGQGAFLALMLPSPRRNYYSIWQNRNLTKAKRRRLERVLRDMLYEEYITEAQYHAYTHLRYFPERASRMPARVK